MWHIDVFSIHSIYILGVPNTQKTLVYMYKNSLFCTTYNGHLQSTGTQQRYIPQMYTIYDYTLVYTRVDINSV